VLSHELLLLLLLLLLLPVLLLQLVFLLLERQLQPLLVLFSLLRPER
jgi:hypothetical protein